MMVNAASTFPILKHLLTFGPIAQTREQEMCQTARRRVKDTQDLLQESGGNFCQTGDRIRL